jgi:hypothetical protein
MSKWMFRILMALMAVNLAVCLYAAFTYEPPAEMCLNGLVMVPHKSGDMWVQKGLLPEHCILVDKD